MIPDYIKFLNQDISWIKTRTCYLALSGSRSHGTFTETSDYDYRGFCIPTKEYYLGTRIFEQAELSEPDTVIYEIRKFIRLAADANPNCLESLFVEPEDIIHVSKFGEEILSNRELFISKKVKHTMCGYAYSQLSRLKSHRSWLLNPPKQPPTRQEAGLPNETLIPQDQLLAATAEVQKELDRMNFDFMEQLDEAIKIEIKNNMSQMLAELKITKEDQWLSAARKVGLSDNFIELMKLERAYESKKREWNQYQIWKANRNPARAEMEAKFGFDGKHALHLVRLLKMAKEILTTGKVIVKRPDREELLSVRNGGWSYEQLIEFAEKQQKELDILYASSTLPHSADKNKLEQLCISLIERAI